MTPAKPECMCTRRGGKHAKHCAVAINALARRHAPRTRKLDTTMSEKGYVTAQRAAELLAIDVATVHRLCADDRLEHTRVGGDEKGRMARLFIAQSALVKYLGPEAAKLLLKGERA